jgi:UDP-3-O-[3-hydroxymyristoyl] glucosamine N-acyltransferase
MTAVTRGKAKVGEGVMVGVRVMVGVALGSATVSEGVRLGGKVLVAGSVRVGVDNSLLVTLGSGCAGSLPVSPGALAGRLHPVRAHPKPTRSNR